MKSYDKYSAEALDFVGELKKVRALELVKNEDSARRIDRRTFDELSLDIIFDRKEKSGKI